MFKVLDTILRIGGIVFILFVIIGVILALIQEQFPTLEKKLKDFFNTDLGLGILVVVGLWAAIGAAYTVTFH